MPAAAPFVFIGGMVGMGFWTGVAIVAVVGAVVGGVAAAVTGGNILEGMLIGAVGAVAATAAVGLAGGGLVGVDAAGQQVMTWGNYGAISGAGGGGAAEVGKAGWQTAAMTAAGQALPYFMEDDPKFQQGEVTDQDILNAQLARERMASAERQAAGAADFHFKEKLALQDDAQAARVGEMKLQESQRRQPHTEAGGIRRAASRATVASQRGQAGGSEQGGARGAPPRAIRKPLLKGVSGTGGVKSTSGVPVSLIPSASGVN